MDTDFEARLQSLIDESDPSVRTQVEQDVHTLLSAGGYSYQTLVNLIEDPNVHESVREIACWVLGKLKHKSSAAILLKAFDRGGASVAWEAAKALGNIKSKRAIKPLINTLLQSEEAEKRAASAYALGLLLDERAVEPLVSALKNKNDSPKVRGAAAEALIWFGKKRKRVVDALINGLGDTSVEVRFWSVFALGELKVKRAVNKLEKLVADDDEILPGWWSVSKEASDALDRIRSKSSEN